MESEEEIAMGLNLNPKKTLMYIDDWICLSLFHRDVKRRNLNE